MREDVLIVRSGWRSRSMSNVGRTARFAQVDAARVHADANVEELVRVPAPDGALRNSHEFRYLTSAKPGVAELVRVPALDSARGNSHEFRYAKIFVAVALAAIAFCFAGGNAIVESADPPAEKAPAPVPNPTAEAKT